MDQHDHREGSTRLHMAYHGMSKYSMSHTIHSWSIMNKYSYIFKSKTHFNVQETYQLGQQHFWKLMTSKKTIEQHDAHVAHHIFNVDQEGSRIMKTHNLDGTLTEY